MLSWNLLQAGKLRFEESEEEDSEGRVYVMSYNSYSLLVGDVGSGEVGLRRDTVNSSEGDSSR